METLKLRKIGNSTGVLLPRHVLERLHLAEGDSLYCVETPRGIELTPYNPEFARQMELAEEIMRENRDVLRELSK